MVTAAAGNAEVLSTMLWLTTDAAQVDRAGRRSTTDGSMDDERAQYGLVGDRASTLATPGQGGEVRLGRSVRAAIAAGAVQADTTITVSRESEMGIPPLGPGMVNVTAPGGAMYRFLPSPMVFQVPVAVTLPYDPLLVPGGVAEDDIRTYFHDDASARWVELPLFWIDAQRREVISLTTCGWLLSADTAGGWKRTLADSCTVVESRAAWQHCVF